MKPTSRYPDVPAGDPPGTVRGLVVPAEHGAPPGGGGDRSRTHSPAELRAEARSVLERTRDIGPSLRRGSRQAIDEIDALTASIRLLQERVDAAARLPQGPAAATELIAARRFIQASLTVVLDLLSEIEH